MQKGVGARYAYGGQVGKDPRKAGKQKVCRQPSKLSREGFDSLCPLQFRYVLLRTLARSLNRASPGLLFQGHPLWPNQQAPLPA